MNYTRLAIVSLVILAAMSIGAQSATYISGHGNDSKNCGSVTKPCASITHALGLAPVGGSIVAMDSSDYDPSGLAISKAITIEAAPGVRAGVSSLSGSGITISAGATDTVVLRGLTIQGASGSASTAVTAQTVGALHIESCVIDTPGIGIQFPAPGKFFMKDTFVRDCVTAVSFGTLALEATNRIFASIDHCRIENSTTGLLVSFVVQVAVRDSVISGNGLGVSAIGSSQGFAIVDMDTCLVSNNGTGITAGFNSTVRIATSTITGNQTGLQIDISSAEILSRGNNTVEDNGTDGTFTATYSPK
jgi:hypothetical protein